MHTIDYVPWDEKIWQIPYKNTLVDPFITKPLYGFPMPEIKTVKQFKPFPLPDSNLDEWYNGCLSILIQNQQIAADNKEIVERILTFTKTYVGESPQLRETLEKLIPIEPTNKEFAKVYGLILALGIDDPVTKKAIFDFGYKKVDGEDVLTSVAKSDPLMLRYHRVITSKSFAEARKAIIQLNDYLPGFITSKMIQHAKDIDKDSFSFGRGFDEHVQPKVSSKTWEDYRLAGESYAAGS